MKLFPVAAFALALAFAAEMPAAESSDALRVHIPFVFVVAGQEFTPGDYMIHQNDSGVVWVQGGGKAAAVLSYPSASAIPGTVSALRFTKSGQKEYLVGVQYQQLNRAIPLPALSQRKLLPPQQ
jgi:hypothetical protein